MARKRYVPLSVTFAHGDTGTKILERYGASGLLVWVCLMAAAKRSSVQGQYIHLSDSETWANFGLTLDPPAFTFDEFLTFTGRLKQTSKRRHGRILYVSLTRWSDWNKEWKQETDAAQKSRKRHVSTPDTPATDDRQTGDKNSTEVECEVEGEKESEGKALRLASESAPAARPRDELWDALAEECGTVVTDSERAIRNRKVKELRKIGATAAEVHRRAALIRARYTTDLTDQALLRHWSKADLPIPQVDAKPTVSDKIRQANERLAADTDFSQRFGLFLGTRTTDPTPDAPTLELDAAHIIEEAS